MDMRAKGDSRYAWKGNKESNWSHQSNALFTNPWSQQLHYLYENKHWYAMKKQHFRANTNKHWRRNMSWTCLLLAREYSIDLWFLFYFILFFKVPCELMYPIFFFLKRKHVLSIVTKCLSENYFKCTLVYYSKRNHLDQNVCTVHPL